MVLVGAVSLGVGYFVLHRGKNSSRGNKTSDISSFYRGPGVCFHAMVMLLCLSHRLRRLCCFCCVNQDMYGSKSYEKSILIIIAALNWPNHRGTATGFPLAAYGLSAFFFSAISSLAFNSDPSGLLVLFTVGTFAMPFLGFFFLHLVPHSSAYVAVPTDEQERPIPNPMNRTKSEESKHARRLSQDPGTQLVHYENTSVPRGVHRVGSPEVPNLDTDETSSLISISSAKEVGIGETNYSRYSDLRGLAIIPTIEFWQLFALLGILTGIGLMTIK